MSCLHTTRFSYEGCTIYVHYYSSLFNGIIHTNIHLFIHLIRSLFFSLLFLCMLVRILSGKIYFLCFFLASLHIALIYYFYTYLYKCTITKSWAYTQKLWTITKRGLSLNPDTPKTILSRNSAYKLPQKPWIYPT